MHALCAAVLSKGISRVSFFLNPEGILLLLLSAIGPVRMRCRIIWMPNLNKGLVRKDYVKVVFWLLFQNELNGTYARQTIERLVDWIPGLNLSSFCSLRHSPCDCLTEWKESERAISIRLPSMGYAQQSIFGIGLHVSISRKFSRHGKRRSNDSSRVRVAHIQTGSKCIEIEFRLPASFMLTFHMHCRRWLPIGIGISVLCSTVYA